jgi:hypothetical protein
MISVSVASAIPAPCPCACAKILCRDSRQLAMRMQIVSPAEVIFAKEMIAR